MQSLLSATLSVFLVLSSVNCLCAPFSVSSQAPDEHAMHMHHGKTAPQGQEQRDCSHQDCQNDCGDISALSKSPETYQVSRQDTDDDISVADVPAIRHPEINPEATGPPSPPHPFLIASTPVKRYDTLLE